MSGFLASSAGLIALALLIEAVCGYPAWLYKIIRHPVIWIGALIKALNRVLNRRDSNSVLRRGAGVLAVCIVVSLAAFSGLFIANALPNTLLGRGVEAVLASSLIAQRSLYTHVAAVATPLTHADLEGARTAVAHIVGRDLTNAETPQLARAAIESLAENMSDGVIAPALWGALLGLPGIAAYKAINTLDSMIGHRNAIYSDFGWGAARLDDLANLIPARFTSLLIALASGLGAPKALRCALRDARRHPSPNAGWPEAAIAGALGVRLSGPRSYGGVARAEPWLNGGAPDPDASSITRALELYRRGCALFIIILSLTAFGLAAWR